MENEVYVFPMSFAQRRLWFLEQFGLEQPVFHVDFALRLHGTLDVQALHQAMLCLIERHESLRTTFAVEDDEPVQVIAAEMEFDLPLADFSALNPVQREAALEQLATTRFEQPFDLGKGPLLRMDLARMQPDEYVLLLNMHHIVTDAWSMGVMIRELAACYSACVQGRDPELPPLEIQYADFAHWQCEWLQGDTLRERLAFWQNHLQGAPPSIDLALDRTRPALRTYRGAVETALLSTELSRDLAALARRHKVSAFMLYYAAFSLLLSRYSNQDDLVIGTPIANRNREELEGLIGFFVNSLALRADLSGTPTFLDLLARTRDRALDAYAHQELPFERLVEALHPDRNTSITPIFQVMLAVQNTPEQRFSLPGMTIEVLSRPRRVTPYDLLLIVDEQEQRPNLHWQYNTDLFETATIRRMAGHFQRLLEQVAADPGLYIKEYSFLTENERRQVLLDWNDTTAPFDFDVCIHQRFAEQAAAQPDAPALQVAGRTTSYGALNRLADAWAIRLHRQGAGPDTRVALCFERSVEMVAAMLATLKAGAAYVPLDPEHPRERLARILDNAQPKVVLTHPPCRNALPQTAAPVLVMDVDQPEPDDVPPIQANIDATAPAYILYTSGSTGQPKGVVIEHRSFMNFNSHYFPMQPGDRISLTCRYVFDVSVLEIFSTLLHGACLHIPSQETVADPRRYAAFLVEHEIAQSYLHPMHLADIAASLREQGTCPLRRLLIGVESIRFETIRWFLEQGVAIKNGYGPTETTICATIFDLPLPADVDALMAQYGPVIPIGRSLPNNRVYVLDPADHPVPVGVSGELFVAGAGVGRGYYGIPEQTARAFAPDPFVSGERMYRTGDLACWMPGGMLRFCGRRDHQMKIRGFRIEPGEVEQHLCAFPGVGKAVVATRDEPATGQRRLVAYLVAATPDEAPALRQAQADMRSFLRKHLPDYMAPAAYVILDALPMTTHGKLDRAALPAPTLSDQPGGAAFVELETDIERQLAHVWVEMLGCEKVGRHDNFFDLGGHSLLATRLVSRLRDAFDVEWPVRYIYETPTLSELATRLALETDAAPAETRDRPLEPIHPVPRQARMPLSFAQKRLWFLNQLEGAGAVYNMPFALRLTGSLNIKALRHAFDEVVRRHEVLRTRFVDEHGAPSQVIDPPAPLDIPLRDLSPLSDRERDQTLHQALDLEASQPFDLARGPLLRVMVVRLEAKKHVVLTTMHHIVSDGWSVAVFNRELTHFYQAFSQNQPADLPLPQIQYVDYAVWQRQASNAERLRRSLDYWREQLAGAPPLLELPTDRPRPPSQTFNGAVAPFRLDPETAQPLRDLCRRENVSMFMLLHAAFCLLLARYSGQDDIVVGTPAANRDRAEIEPLIGFFVNTLALRLDLSGQPTFRELLARMRRVALDAYAHQDLPFEQLVEALQPQRHLGYSPLFQVMFTLRNTPEIALHLAGLTIEPLALGNGGTARFDITLGLNERDGALEGAAEYNTDLFDADTITRMLEHFRLLLAYVCAHPDQDVTRAPLLSAEERQRILVAWNATTQPYPQDAGIHTLIEQRATVAPNAEALVCGHERLSYAELNLRADRLADHLLKLGVTAETPVGLCLNRTADLPVAMLAILKSGGAYVPLDPAYPPERIAFMLRDSGARFLITHSALLPDLGNDLPDRIVCLDADRDAIASASPERMDRPSADPGRLAYILYTSGSTGTPKGVAIEHCGPIALAAWADRIYDQHDWSGVLAGTSVCFDLSIFEILVTLMRGGRVILAENALTPASLPAAAEITLINTVPSVITALLDEGRIPESVRTINLAGEPLRPALVDRTYDLGHVERVYDLYGPSEDTTYSTWTLRGRNSIETIGRPLDNEQAYILDANGQPVPVGVPGELYLGGVGLARGYWQRPELNRQKFVPNPFVDQAGVRLYRTGDRARFLADGRIVFMGRFDHQVKIHGFRIELGEIEARLRQHERVRDVVTVARQDQPGALCIVAYVVDRKPDLEKPNLRTWLPRHLPKYMTPAHVVWLDEMPLTPNGKIDRRRLPQPMVETSTATYALPQTETEKILTDIWGAVLMRDRIGRNDNFFELGGHSLLATQTTARIRDALGIEAPLRDLFEHPTLAALAAALDKRQLDTLDDADLAGLLDKLEQDEEN